MPNMSYCRFRNTMMDLQDCYDHMDDAIDDPAEHRAQRALIALCCEIARDYGEDVVSS